MVRSCYSCLYYDAEHRKKYNEMKCKNGNRIIKLKYGQPKPDDCPLKRKKDRYGAHNDI